jgi:predicted dehydrogenase
MRAADAGKAVLCEKPLTLNADEARMLVDYFKNRNLPLAEAFMYRFHPQTARVKELVDSGAVGDVKFINASFSFAMQADDDIRLYKAMGGGALMDVGCYCVSIMRLITGEEPDEVRAFARFNSDGVDLSAVGLLSFPSGILGHFDCAMNAQLTNVYEVRGTHGRIVADPAFIPDFDKGTVIKLWQEEQYQEISIPAVQQYQLMVEDFADAILNKRPPRFPAEDAVRNMQVLDSLRIASGWTLD